MAYNNCIYAIIRYFPIFLSINNQQTSVILFVLLVAPMQFIANRYMFLPYYYGILFRKAHTALIYIHP